MVSDMYNQFVRAVSQNRVMPEADVIQLADGRVYTGKQSIELGLIDAIGTFEDAIVLAGSMGQISGKPKTVQVNKKRPSLLDWFSGNLGQTVSGWFDELPAYRWRME
jgi:protease-4